MKFVLILACVLMSATTVQAVVVAPDGSGEFTTVQAAVDSIPTGNNNPVIIHIKPGTYKERVLVPQGKPNLTFEGEDALTTILTYHLNSKSTIAPDTRPVGTSGSYSTQIQASNFTAQNITFENTAGDTGQALALSAVGDRQIYRHCRLLGWQDTLYANGGRQYYDRCYIEGRVDFIFGSAVAVFDHCEIHSKNGGHVTAASTLQTSPWGYVFLDCTLTGDGVKADLGRPWKPYASVTYVRCELGSHIIPAGFSAWKGNDNDKTARYAEYQNTGPGAQPDKRVSFDRQLGDEEASGLTVEKLLAGNDKWNPTTRPAS